MTIDNQTKTLIAAAIAAGGAAGSALMLAGEALPNERPVYYVADYVDQAVDCKVWGSYGGVSEPLCDIAPAINRALAACEATVTTRAFDRDIPCVVEGRPGLYYWSKRVDVCHPTEIRLPGAKIFTAKLVGSALRFEGFGRCTANGRPTSGRSSFESNGLFRPFLPSSTVAATAIEIFSSATVRDVSILGYTAGIQIYANASATLLADRANANGWGLDHVIIQSSKWRGISVDGPDVNVGVATNVGATTSCTQGTALSPALGACADIFDGSFLGSTWVAAKTGYAKDPATSEVFPGIVLGDSANSRSVCVGCYIEGGYGGGVVANTANVVGGIGGWAGSGNRLEGNVMSGLELVGSDGLISVRMGSLTGGGALTLTPLNASGTYPLRWKYDATNLGILANVGNVSGGHALRIGVKSTALGGLGGLLLRPYSTTTNVYLNSSGYVVTRQVP